jgi:hypothetical protein
MAPFIELVQLEVHPEYRRRGIGTRLVQALFKDCPQNNFYLECGIDQTLYTFYAKLGFSYFFKNMGNVGYHFIKLINPLDHVMQYFHEMDVFYPEDNTDYAGCIWSDQEKRFINTRRTEEEEIAVVEKEPWQIYSVRKQTLQLQRIVVENDPSYVTLIDNPLPEIRKMVLMKNPTLADELEERSLLENS